jgi:hypothetical protein
MTTTTAAAVAANVQYIRAQCAAAGVNAAVFSTVTPYDGDYITATYYGDIDAVTRLHYAGEVMLVTMLATSRHRSEAAARKRVMQNEHVWHALRGATR